jgi:hypothetical protein
VAARAFSQRISGEGAVVQRAEGEAVVALGIQVALALIAKSVCLLTSSIFPSGYSGKSGQLDRQVNPFLAV